MPALENWAPFDRRVAAARRFNRFYTEQIGVLEEGFLDSPFSLTEARVLYELAHRSHPTARDLSGELGLDAGYLSRILAGFARRGLIEKSPSKRDARQRHLALTRQGKQAFAPLDARSRNGVAAMLAPLTESEQNAVIESMGTIERLLGPRTGPGELITLRSHRPGDLGWVVHRHGVVYAQEYGWDHRFEALVAGIVARFVETYDPSWERCWIAERDGVNVGSVFLVRSSKTIAQLRLLLVEPHARGLGIGTRLVEECISFARQAGYRKIVLWTNDVLRDARAIYERAGFRLVRAAPHRSFGHDLVGQPWELKLKRARG